jgi:hypothetical protein
LNDARTICCLCGGLGADDDKITREHVPPKQFFPKELRAGLNLWVVPTHRSCNSKHQADEEYFYHALYPLVAKLNRPTAGLIWDDLKRRATKPQTPKLLRMICNTARKTTEGGVELPPSVIQLSVDEYRLQQVAIKIGRCLFYRDHKRVMRIESCKDIRLCENEEDVPDLYSLSWDLSRVNVNDMAPSWFGEHIVVPEMEAGQALAACRKVFDYRPAYLEEERLHLYTLRFWEAFAFCMAFEEPDDVGV